MGLFIIRIALEEKKPGKAPSQISYPKGDNIVPLRREEIYDRRTTQSSFDLSRWLKRIMFLVQMVKDVVSRMQAIDCIGLLWSYETAPYECEPAAQEQREEPLGV